MFGTDSSLFGHYTSKHIGIDLLTSMECSMCGVVLKDNIGYLDHLREQHSNELLESNEAQSSDDIGCPDEFDLNEILKPQIKKIEIVVETKQLVIKEPVTVILNAKTWTCQLCKKQFDQRLELSKHQCIELNLKLLKKKMDMRKKKWREAHHKRKIDLSHIETTTLTHLSQNVADNLAFCIDGTSEDMKAYAKEVKDYLNTEMGTETHEAQTLRSLGMKTSQAQGLQKRADTYFQKQEHDQHIKTTFDVYQKQSQLYKCDQEEECGVAFLSSDVYATESVGYLSSDPFAYIVNLYWDQKLSMRCDKCHMVLNRPKYRKHTCMESSEEEEDITDMKEEEEEEGKEVEMVCQQVVAFLLDEVESAQESEVVPSLRVSTRIRRSSQRNLADSDNEVLDANNKLSKSNSMSLVSVRTLNSRKIHTCLRCGLEFTSANSVSRHQEKSCLRVRVINLKSNAKEPHKKKCPICSCTFHNTHRLSIHIYKHHRNLLGSAGMQPTNEAKRMHQVQMKKLNSGDIEEMEEDEEEDGETEETEDEDSKLSMTL